MGEARQRGSNLLVFIARLLTLVRPDRAEPGGAGKREVSTNHVLFRCRFAPPKQNITNSEHNELASSKLEVLLGLGTANVSEDGGA